ncbi:protein transport protein Sec16A-like [Coregonus clupeaformis]|uniref:protein transport protein Sec16A-like n=1 Tax=Coregonus clupeaformis TaxID=59861 RepID=UPI001E1C8B80|nr:protein transport protein Sec16A-like [Coregonus clupeaformis]
MEGGGGVFPKTSVSAQREGILPKACVHVKNGDNRPQPPSIVPMVGRKWEWDGGVYTSLVDFYSKRRDVRSRHVVHPAMMSITKPEHSEANPQSQTGSRPVAEPETPAAKNTPNNGGWLSWVFWRGKEVNPKEDHLPEDKDKSIVWDPTMHRWVDKTEPKAEQKPVPPPPPMGINGSMELWQSPQRCESLLHESSRSMGQLSQDALP